MKINFLNRKTNLVFASIAFAGSFLSAGLVQAEGAFDPAECVRIKNVDVPFEVDANDSELTFSGASHIKISDAGIEIDRLRYFERDSVAAMHKDLRKFLHSAVAMATTSAAFGSDWDKFDENLTKESFADEVTDEFLTAVTNMCKAVLELNVSQSKIAASFDAFVPPVWIELSE